MLLTILIEMTMTIFAIVIADFIVLYIKKEVNKRKSKNV